MRQEWTDCFAAVLSESCCGLAPQDPTRKKLMSVATFAGAAQSIFFPVWLLIAVPLSSSGFCLHGSP